MTTTTERIEALVPGQPLWIVDPYSHTILTAPIKTVGASVIVTDDGAHWTQRYRRLDHPDSGRLAEQNPSAVGALMRLRLQFAYPDRRSAMTAAIGQLHRKAEQLREAANNADVQAEAYLRQLGT